MRLTYRLAKYSASVLLRLMLILLFAFNYYLIESKKKNESLKLVLMP